MMLRVRASTFSETHRRQETIENLKSSQRAAFSPLFFFFSLFFIFPADAALKKQP